MAGGSDGSYLDSVELNVAGENGWTYGFPLPKQLWAPRGVTVMSWFYIIGELARMVGKWKVISDPASCLRQTGSSVFAD